MNHVQVKMKMLHPDAVIPEYQTPGAACFDLHAIEGGLVGKPDTLGWNPDAKQAITFRTGLAFEIPEGHVMLVFSRSGHGFKSDVRLSNCVGVIDSDFRGELAVRLAADGFERLVVKPGDRIAQAMVIPRPVVTFRLEADLGETERGAGGFGSTDRLAACKALAAKLDGIVYPCCIPKAIKDEAKADGLVIVFGASDDLIEFEGAICDEAGVYGGGEVLVDAKGLVIWLDEDGGDEELEQFFARKKTAKTIGAVWGGDECDGVSWTYKTSIPHATFDVMEDGEVYCRGIVFSVEDLS